MTDEDDGGKRIVLNLYYNCTCKVTDEDEGGAEGSHRTLVQLLSEVAVQRRRNEEISNLY